MEIPKKCQMPLENKNFYKILKLLQKISNKIGKKIEK